MLWKESDVHAWYWYLLVIKFSVYVHISIVLLNLLLDDGTLLEW